MIERVQKVEVVLEAFGNSATTFNSNSTRHINYFELTFTRTGKLSGGILWAYCLEKWRVTQSQSGR
jgi:myosin heavy subunit